MKIIKNTQFGEINTSIDGVLYCIIQDGIEVSDEIAAKMKEYFLHTVEVSDVVVQTKVVEPTVEETNTVEVIEQSPIIENNIE